MCCSHSPPEVPPTGVPGSPDADAPALVAPLRATCIGRLWLRVAGGQWWGSDGARAALSRGRPVAWREFPPVQPPPPVLPAGRRWRVALGGRPPPQGRSPAAGDLRTQITRPGP